MCLALCHERKNSFIAFAKSSDQCHLPQSQQADIGQNLFTFKQSWHVTGHESFIVTQITFDHLVWYNSLPNGKILDQSKLKAFTDDKLKPIKMEKTVQDMIENIVGKEENAGNQHFLLFPQYFQKAFSLGSLKIGIVC